MYRYLCIVRSSSHEQRLMSKQSTHFQLSPKRHAACMHSLSQTSIQMLAEPCGPLHMHNSLLEQSETDSNRSYRRCLNDTRMAISVPE